MIITVQPDERLLPHQVCLWLNIPLSSFQKEVDAGLWDGTYVMAGSERRFIAKLVQQKQEELATKVGQIAERERKNPGAALRAAVGRQSAAKAARASAN